MNETVEAPKKDRTRWGKLKDDYGPRNESLTVSCIRRYQGANTIAKYVLLKLITIKFSFSFQYPEIVFVILCIISLFYDG